MCRRESLPATTIKNLIQMDASIELLRPWKLATLAIVVGLPVVGSFYYEAPDWDIPIGITMG